MKPGEGFYDQVARILGRPFPNAIDYLLRILWWPLFLLGMASLWPPTYPFVERWLAGHGVDVVLPPGRMVIPAMALLTVFLLGHAELIRRRTTLAANGAGHGS